MVKKPNSRRNLDMAIRRAFGDDRFVQMRTLIANTIVAHMLPDGVIKGGSGLKMRLGDEGTRFTSDLDTATPSSAEAYAEGLEKSLEEGWEDFTGFVVPREPAHPKTVPAEYVMRPFDVKLSYCGQPWCTVRLEVGCDEIGDAEQADIELSSDIAAAFVKIGLPEPGPVPLMIGPYQIAQKLHGVSALGSDRVRDLVDLQLTAREVDIDYGITRTVCERLFSYRKLQEWPPTVVKGSGWDSIYAAESMGLDVLPTVDDAVSWTNDLIARIAGATEAGCEAGL